MKFSWLLFDIDNTLLDFNGASKASFWKTCSEFGKQSTEEIYKQYKEINHGVWMEFEQGEIDAVTLRTKRFQGLLDLLDWSEPTAQQFSVGYLQNLVLSSEAYDGAIALLQELKSTYKLSVITNGLKEVQRPRLNKLDMIELFDSIVVSDEIGVAKPDPAYFEYVYQSISNPPPKSEILVIGDSLNSDIQGGNNFGVATCWISHGKENQSEIKPDFKIESVLELPNILG